MAQSLNGKYFTGRNPIQFYVPDAPTLNVVGANALFNNPTMYKVAAGQVGKIEMALNGNTFYRGDTEYAPFAIELDWKQLGFDDYVKLAMLRKYFVHLIDHRGRGYYGKLLVDGPANDNVKSADIVSCKATIFTLTPSDYGGLALPVSRVATPTAATLGTVANVAGGSIAAGTSYYWLAFKTTWGETDPYAFSVTTIANSRNNIPYVWPATTQKVTSATLYVNATNDYTTSKQIGENIIGESPIFVDLVGYNGAKFDVQPPVPGVNTAYRGDWMGGIWINETP